MKACGGVEVSIHAFLTSTLDGDEWSALLHLYIVNVDWRC